MNIKLTAKHLNNRPYLGRAILFLAILAAPVFYVSCPAKTAFAALNGEKSIIQRIESRYSKVYSISAYFYQDETIPGYSQNIQVRGRFYYLRGNGMAWIYQYPFHKRQVFKDGYLYIINDKNKKVTVIDVNKIGGFPPNVVRVLGNMTKYFEVLKVFPEDSRGIIKVELKPFAEQRAKKIYIGFESGNLKIASMKILTYQGQTITFEYKFVKFNGYIKKTLFDVNFPGDYTVMRENQF